MPEGFFWVGRRSKGSHQRKDTQRHDLAAPVTRFTSGHGMMRTALCAVEVSAKCEGLRLARPIPGHGDTYAQLLEPLHSLADQRGARLRVLVEVGSHLAFGGQRHGVQVG